MEDKDFSRFQKIVLKTGILVAVMLLEELHNGFGEIARAIRKKGELTEMYNSDSGYDIEWMNSRTSELICYFEEQLNSEHFHSPVDSLKFIRNNAGDNEILKEYAETLLKDGCYANHNTYVWYKFLVSTFIPTKYL